MQKLSHTEIDYVLSGIEPIKGIDKNISQKIFDNIVNDLKESLKKVEIYPEMIDELKNKITKFYYETQVSPGDSVGIYTAQSIGERQTQLALDSFHSTGITTSTVVTGVPRFNELVNATKNPKNVLTTIYLKKKYKTIQELRNSIVNIKHITFKDIIYKTEIQSRRLENWYKLFDDFDIYKYTHSIRCFCDTRQLYINRITLYELAQKINNHFTDIYCIFSPTPLGILDIWFDASCLEIPSGKSYITKKNRHIICVEEILMPVLRELSIRGISGIEQIFYVNKNNEWIIEAQGFNLPELYTVDIVDETKTISNHMWEIYDTLGIEATREFLINEFISIISIDSYINVRHIQLLVDVMLYTGGISSISRYGVHKNQSGALTKCSFEESLDQILKAGIYGENEKINGVSGAIICGKVSNIGSGLCDLVYDLEMKQ